MSSETLNNLSTIVETICEERHDYKSLAEWRRIKDVYEEELPRLRDDVQKLKEQTNQLAEPPFHYAVYLGPCPANANYLIVGDRGLRIEVHAVPEKRITARELKPGQLVLLNKEQNVVDVRQEYVYGETAEVVNVLKGDEEAEVLLVLAESLQYPLRLQIKWRENEEIEVTCSDELKQMGVQRGDLVRVDSDRRVALAKARPRLHVKVAGNEGNVVEVSDRLAEQGVQIGDIVRIEAGLKFAFEKLPAYETGKLTLEDVPDVTYEDIGGLDEQISHIYDAIELPYLYREQFEQYQLVRPKGILLYGPPGCGKTMIAKAVANSLTTNIRSQLTTLERVILVYKQWQQTPDDSAWLEQFRTVRPVAQSIADSPLADTTGDPLAELTRFLQQHDVNLNAIDDKLQEIRSVLSKPDGIRSFFLNVKGPELLDKYVGETEHRIRKIFEEARRYSSFYTPVIIFFDEMEAMFRTRGTGRSSDIETTIVPQFLSEIDGVESIENLIIIGASNRQDMIDPAILRPGRLDVKIKIDRPSRQSAQDIFAMYLPPILPLNPEGLTIPDATEGMQGEVVFRTVYRGKSHVGPFLDGKNLDELLPSGCDLRLAFSFGEADLRLLSTLPPKSRVREVINMESENSFLKNKLHYIKSELEIGEFIERLTKLSEQYQLDTALQARIIYFMRQEWIAETMLLQAIELLYNPMSTINVLADDGSRYTYPLKDFMSGAIIANIATRAKRRAIKRTVLEGMGGAGGISWDDVLGSIRQEFAESREQFARQKLSESGKMIANIQEVEVMLEAGEVDPWSEEKIELSRPTAPLVL